MNDEVPRLPCEHGEVRAFAKCKVPCDDCGHECHAHIVTIWTGSGCHASWYEPDAEGNAIQHSCRCTRFRDDPRRCRHGVHIDEGECEARCAACNHGCRAHTNSPWWGYCGGAWGTTDPRGRVTQHWCRCDGFTDTKPLPREEP